MLLYLSIAILGAFGVLLRFFLDKAFAGNTFPFATLLINILGSFCIGLVFVLGNEKGYLSKDLSIAISVGFLGGFTTFSAYALQTVLLAKDQQQLSSILYFCLSPILSVAAAYLSFTIVRSI